VQHVPGLAKLLINHIVSISLPTTDTEEYGLALVFDLLPDDLYQFALSQKRPLTLDNVKHLARQLLTTISELNKLGFTHNDIKPENIMIKDSRTVPMQGARARELCLVNPEFVLIDFAYASTDCIIAGTSTYYSPEQLVNQGGVCRQFGHLARTQLVVS
jgi:serine/threonine protein kinase